GRRFLLVAAVRSDAAGSQQVLAQMAEAERIDLGGLSAEAIFTLLDRRAGAPVPPEVARLVAERSDGNPLIATEMLRHLEATGALVRTDGRIEAAPGWQDLRVPSRLRDLFV